jgi:uncharacterized protein
MTNLHDIFLDQKRERDVILSRPFIERDANIDGLDSGLIHLISGPRRSGKSSYGLWQCRNLDAGYINFDDERLLQRYQEMDEFIQAMTTVYHNPQYLFMDEIQNVPSWELIVNRLARQGFRLIISGSNAHLLSSELATHLTGRYSQTLILPFSFTEYARVKPAERTTMEMQELLFRYSETGGFPEPLVTNINSTQYLIDLIDAVLYKDIIRRFTIRNPGGIGDLASYLLSTIGNEFSLQNLTRICQVKSVHTVRKYLEFLESAYLLFSVPRFSYKVREQVAYNKKIYAYDNGLVTARGFLFSENRGKLLENLVATVLHAKEITGEMSLFFWKNQDQEEVDFVIKKGREVVMLIQVCAQITSKKVLDREIRSLLKGKEELRCNNLVLLTDTESGTEKYSWHEYSGVIQKIPLWKWLYSPFISMDSITD